MVYSPKTKHKDNTKNKVPKFSNQVSFFRANRKETETEKQTNRQT